MSAVTETRRTAPARQYSRVWAGVTGVVAAGSGIALAELAGIITGPGSTPVLAVSDAVVDLTPAWAKDAAIALFGTNDKLFLFVVVGAVALAVAFAAGVLEARKPGAGGLLAAGLAAVAGLAALTRPGAGVLSLLPAFVAGVVGLVLLRVLVPRVLGQDTVSGRDTGEAPGLGRRVVLLGSTATAALVAGVGGRAVGRRAAGGEASRAAVALPAAASTVPDVPASSTFDDIEGLQDFVVANDSFYRIDTALVVPSVTTAEWSLRIHGMVEQEVEIDFADLMSRDLVEKYLTLSCVSNPVGGDLVGNALWLGLPTAELLAEARPTAEADMVLSTSVDGWTAGTPVEALTDDRQSLLAVGMNGEPLPAQHGFPVRLVVPGLYGYVSATKWVVDLELTRFDLAQGYWTPRGWTALGPVKVQSRIDRPRGGTIDAGSGPYTVAGLAWAMDEGVAAVEVRADGGEWREAELAEAGTASTWRQWRYEWDAQPGLHLLECRAISQTGERQLEDPAPPAPSGAQGIDSVEVRVA